MAVLRIAPSRGGKVARALLEEDFAGFLVSDRWSGYEWHDAGCGRCAEPTSPGIFKASSTGAARAGVWASI